MSLAGLENSGGAAASTDRVGAWLWVAQRGSAGVLALCVLIYLVTIQYASQGGLSAAEVLARTRGHAGLLAFYGLFTLAVAVHVPIGLRNVAAEWLHWRGRSIDVSILLLALALLAGGWRAAWALYR